MAMRAFDTAIFQCLTKETERGGLNIAPLILPLSGRTNRP